jgi:hypothetical protein
MGGAGRVVDLDASVRAHVNPKVRITQDNFLKPRVDATG